MPSPSPAERAATSPGAPRTGVIACGALAAPVADIASRRGWALDVHPLSPLLHNRPERIAAQVAGLALALRDRYARPLGVAYADCGTYGALDDVCTRLGLHRLPGAHCYDVFGGRERITALLAEEPGTYLLTDFLVRTFERTVLTELGLDRWPQLRDDYFGAYRRVVWLAQQPDAELRTAALRAAAAIGLPLEVVPVGDGGLEAGLADLLAAPARQQP